MIVIGLTGNLASGKSETAGIFKKFGGKIFDADGAARAAVRKGTPAYHAIVKMFSKEYLLTNGQIDRKKLAKRVFAHPGDLKKLNILIHPGVIFECLGMIHRLKRRKGVLVLDIPLLFESKMQALADFTVVVRTGKEEMLRRAEKKGVPRELAKNILSAQWPIAKKARLADFVIDNDGSLENLKEKVGEILKLIQKGRA